MTKLLQRIVLVSLLTPQLVQAVLLELKSVTTESNKDGLEWVSAYAPSIVQFSYKTPDGVEAKQSGFFINNELILTAFPTDLKSINCSGLTIRTFTNLKDAQNYSCETIVEEDKRLGYAIIKVREKIAPSISFIKNTEAGIYNFKKGDSFVQLGFSPFDQLMHANHCSAAAMCKTCLKHPEIKNRLWLQGRCMTYDTMVGGPILAKVNGKMKVVGLSTDLFTPSKDNWGIKSDQQTLAVSMESLKRVSDILYKFQPPPVCTLSANRDSMEMGQKLTLKIMVNGIFDDYEIEGVKSAKLREGVYLDFNPLKGDVFSAKVKGPGGIGICTTTVKVKIIPPPSCEVTASKGEINVGEKVTFSVKPNGRFKSVVDENGNEISKDANGNYEFKDAPKKTKLYRVAVNGIGGQGFCYARVKVENPNAKPPTCTLSANPATIKLGQKTILSISTKGNVTQTWILGKATTSLEVTPQNSGDNNYSARVSGPFGTTRCSTTVKVTP